MDDMRPCPMCRGTGKTAISRRKPRLTDDEFRAAWFANGCWGSKTAKAIGMQHGGVCRRAKALGLPRHMGPKERVIESDFRRMFDEAKGDTKLLVGLTGLSYWSVIQRCKRLGLQFVRRRTYSSPKSRATLEIARAIVETEGKEIELAKRLGISRERARQIVDRQIISPVAAAMKPDPSDVNGAPV